MKLGSLCILISATFFMCTDLKEDIAILKSKAPLNKVEIKCVSMDQVHYITITSPDELKKANEAFQKMTPINVNTGGVYDIWAQCFAYKKGRKIEFWVHKSNYHGWHLDIPGDIGSATYKSDYFFDLMTKIADTSFKKTVL
jgi:hypothetical protein